MRAGAVSARQLTGAARVNMARAEAAAAGNEAGSEPPASGPGVEPLAPERLKKLYRDMLLIRRFEEKAGQLYGIGLIGGFYHLYIRQETRGVGMQPTRKPTNQGITTSVEPGHMNASAQEP